MNELRQVEINGIKFEVDMRTAQRIDTFKIGDNIKILDKTYSNPEILNGIIVEFLNFKDLPTIQIAYFDESYYSNDNIRFININEQTEGYEIMPASIEEFAISKTRFIDMLNRKIEKAQKEVDDLEGKKEWFVNNYAKYFGGNNYE